MYPSKFYATLITVLILSCSTLAHASSSAPSRPNAGDFLKKPGKIGKLNPGRWAADYAFGKAMGVLDLLMQDGAKPGTTEEKTDADGNALPGAGAGTGTGTGSYPYEFIVDGQVFDSAKAAHEYNITTRLTKDGLIRTRRSDGLFYDHLDIYYGKEYYGTGVGYIISSVQAASAKNPPENLIGGSIKIYSGTIYYKGKLSTTTTHDYTPEQKKAFEDAFNKAYDEALALGIPAVPKPDIEDQPKPGEAPVPDIIPDQPMPKPPDTKPANDPDYNPKPKPLPVPKPFQPEPPAPTKPDNPAPPDTKPDTPGKPDPKKDPGINPNPDKKPGVRPAPSPSNNPDKDKDKDKDKDEDEDKDEDKDEDEDPDKDKDPKKDPDKDKDPKADPKKDPDKDKDPKADPKKDPSTGTNTTDKFKLPEFCEWARPVCDFIDWVKEEPPDDGNDKREPLKAKPIKIDESKMDRRYYDATGQCPANQIIHVIGGTIEFSYFSICELFRRLAPFIMATAYLSGAYIILGASRA